MSRKKICAFLLAFSLALPMACTKGGGKATEVSPMETAGMLRNDFAVLVDVREVDELAGGMAEPAISMPMSKIEKNDPEWQAFLEKLPRDKQIVFYCAGGVRSGKAARMLAEKGYRAANMGGLSDWVKAGLPVRKP